VECDVFLIIRRPALWSATHQCRQQRAQSSHADESLFLLGSLHGCVTCQRDKCLGPHDSVTLARPVECSSDPHCKVRVSIHLDGVVVWLVLLYGMLAAVLVTC
jgi:hypothetical protein